MSEATVFVVDDDAALRESLALLAESVGLRVKTFGTGKSFLDVYSGEPGCVIADIRMPGMSGLELQEQLAARGHGLPVIILSAHADVPAAVRAMKGGAIDLIEKPFNAQVLLELIQKAMGRDAEERANEGRDARVAERMAVLTARELEVMKLVVEGKANKVMAAELGISERTVELHRGRVMKKVGARSVAELVRMTLS